MGSLSCPQITTFPSNRILSHQKEGHPIDLIGGKKMLSVVTLSFCLLEGRSAGLKRRKFDARRKKRNRKPRLEEGGGEVGERQEQEINSQGLNLTQDKREQRPSTVPEKWIEKEIRLTIVLFSCLLLNYNRLE